MKIRKIAANAIYFGVIPKIGTLLNVFTLPIITPFLSARDFGIWGLISSYTALGMASYSLGMHMHFTNSFYEYGKFFNKLWGRIASVIFISALLLSTVISLVIAPLFEEYNIVTKVVISVLACMPMILNFNVLMATHYYTLKSSPKPLVFRNLAASVVGILVLIVCVYFFHLGYVAFVLGAATNAIVGFVLFIRPMWIAEKLYPRLERNFNRLRLHLKQSLPVIPHAIGFIIISSSSRIVLSFYDVDLDEIGLFSNGYVVGDYISILTAAIVTSIVPLMQDFYRKRNYKSYRLIYYVAQISSLAMVIIFSLWMNEIYGLLMRNEDLQAAAQIAEKIAWANVVLPFYFFLSTPIFIEKRTTKLLHLVFLPGILNLFLAFVFVPIYGVSAVVYSTIIAYWSQLLIPALSGYHRKLLGLWFFDYRSPLVLLLILVTCFVSLNTIVIEGIIAKSFISLSVVGISLISVSRILKRL